MHSHIFSKLQDIAHPFKGILLDAYGVFWGGNGVGILPGSLEAMQSLFNEGKVIGILSNSTQLASKEREKVHSHGIVEGKNFHFFVTSGDITRQAFKQSLLPFKTLRNKYWLFGEPHPKFSSPHSLFEGSPFSATPHLEEADFIFVAIPHINGNDQINQELFRKSVQEIIPSKLPLVCPNPDRFAYEGTPPQLVVRQGCIAAMYEEEGGQVYYIGKPGKMAYASAMQHFNLRGITEPNEILMVGDTPETDIKGARAYGMASALITETGIMAERIAKEGLEPALAHIPPNEQPTFLIRRL